MMGIARPIGMVALMIGMAAALSRAGVIVYIYQAGSDVDALATGSINTAGLTYFGGGTSQSFVEGSESNVLVGDNSTRISDYRGLAGPASFGPGAGFDATSGFGDRFGIVGGTLGSITLATDYVSGGSINGGAVFAGTTLAGLGLTAGTYDYTLPNDTVVVEIGTAPPSVPEPSSLTLCGVAGAIGLIIDRMRRRTVKA